MARGLLLIDSGNRTESCFHELSNASHRRSFAALCGSCGIQPGLPAAFQGEDFFISVVKEFNRRTGACMFSRSGAIGDNLFVTRNLFHPRFDFIERDLQSAFDFVRVIVFVAHIYDDDGLLAGHR
jgi:hypothetical protein